MSRALFLILLVFVCFLIENILFVFCGNWFKPNFLLLLIIFFNLFRGIRYSFFVAFVAGLLKDSVSAKMFGLNIFSMMACAYITTYIKISIYQAGVGASRAFLVFLIVSIYFVIQYSLNIMGATIPLSEAMKHVYWVEMFSTLIVTSYFFKKLKRCVLNFFA